MCSIKTTLRNKLRISKIKPGEIDVDYLDL